jgi:hypothetical protein
MWIQKTLTTDVCRTSWSCYKKLGLFCHNWKSLRCVCSQEDPKKPCCNLYTENPNHRCMQLHFMKLLQQALTVLSQLEKLHNVSAVRRTRNTSKETMLLQCVIQKTLTHSCMQLHFTKLLQQALIVLSKRAVSATLYIWWHACYNLSLSLSHEV